MFGSSPKMCQRAIRNNDSLVELTGSDKEACRRALAAYRNKRKAVAK